MLKQISILFALVLLQSGCFNKKKITEISGSTMGTTYAVKVSDHVPSVDNLKFQIDRILEKVNKQMSTYDPESEISKLNKSAKNTPVKISDWFFEVLNFSVELAKITEGHYDPTIGPLVNLWGFGPDGIKKVPKEDEIKKIKSYVGYQKLILNSATKEVTKTNDKVYVDLSSSAKGFGVDKVSELLQMNNLNNHMVEIGGEIKVSGFKDSNKKPWVIAIEKPVEGKRAVQEIIELKDKSVATSGNYRNNYKEGGESYSHTIDPKSGKPVKSILLSVSVFSKSCMEADAWATALMALGDKKAQQMVKEKNLDAFLIL